MIDAVWTFGQKRTAKNDFPGKWTVCSYGDLSAIFQIFEESNISNAIIFWMSNAHSVQSFKKTSTM